MKEKLKSAGELNNLIFDIRKNKSYEKRYRYSAIY